MESQVCLEENMGTNKNNTGFIQVTEQKNMPEETDMMGLFPAGTQQPQQPFLQNRKKFKSPDAGVERRTDEKVRGKTNEKVQLRVHLNRVAKKMCGSAKKNQRTNRIVAAKNQIITATRGEKILANT